MRAQAGAGLGLSLVKSFIELHGGTVDDRIGAGHGHHGRCCRLPARLRLPQDAQPAEHAGGVIAARHQRPGTPFVVEYSKCSASPGWTSGWIACAASAASAKPDRISLSLPG